MQKSLDADLPPSPRPTAGIFHDAEFYTLEEVAAALKCKSEIVFKKLKKLKVKYIRFGSLKYRGVDLNRAVQAEAYLDPWRIVFTFPDGVQIRACGPNLVAQQRALCLETDSAAAQPAELATAWPTLPLALREAIAALVMAACSPAEGCGQREL